MHRGLRSDEARRSHTRESVGQRRLCQVEGPPSRPECLKRGPATNPVWIELSTGNGSTPIRIALVCQGFRTGGGVPTVTRWLRDGLKSTGDYSVDIFDLATSRGDRASRRVARPRTWFRRSLRDSAHSGLGIQHWGANAVELEPMRYRPRAELTRALNQYDLIQVVAGGPALAAAVASAVPPVVLQVATVVRWERPAILAARSRLRRWWGHTATALTSRIERSAVRSVDAVLVENDLMLAQIRAMGQARVLKAPPGINTEHFTPAETGWKGDGPLLSVSRLGESRKGLDRAILAYNQLACTGRPIPDLILAGKGSLSASDSGLIRSLGLESRISVRSDVNVADLPALYQGASVFIQTSHEEGLGLSTVEAMASGLPVVATETAGSRETVVHGVTGWLVPQDPRERIPIELASRVGQLLESGESMGKRARSRAVERFSHEAALRHFTDTYEDILGTRSSHAAES
jgi:glycosyltransferase involved in cell wall biosynthesis